MYVVSKVDILKWLLLRGLKLDKNVCLCVVFNGHIKINVMN